MSTLRMSRVSSAGQRRASETLVPPPKGMRQTLWRCAVHQLYHLSLGLRIDHGVG